MICKQIGLRKENLRKRKKGTNGKDMLLIVLTNYITMNINQLMKKDKLTKKEETYLWKKLVSKADEVFSKWIRERDKAKGCITKGTT